MKQEFLGQVWPEETELNVDGLTFALVIAYDDDADPPWEREDGHGPVSDWTRRDKRPGEWTLAEDRGGFRRFYDAAGAQRIALREHWGPHRMPHERPRIAARLHHRWAAPGFAARLQGWLTARFGTKPPSARQVAAAAVAEDFQFLRAWCANDWVYLGYQVTLLDECGRPTAERDSCWGFESCDGYILAAAREAAESIANQIRTAERADVRAEQRAMFRNCDWACA